MNRIGQTILITGATSGLGWALAVKLHQMGRQVIATGRRTDKLAELAALCPGLATVTLEMTDRQELKEAAEEVLRRFPALDMVINNAGMAQPIDLTADEFDFSLLDQELDTNVRGLLQLTLLLLPHLRQQPQATLVTVSSGLALVPLAEVPLYCATKAFVHSLTLSLRQQLQSTSVRVTELLPPYMQTGLKSRKPGAKRPPAFPLDAFVERALKGLAVGEDEVGAGLSEALVADHHAWMAPRFAKLHTEPKER